MNLDELLHALDSIRRRTRQLARNGRLPPLRQASAPAPQQVPGVTTVIGPGGSPVKLPHPDQCFGSTTFAQHADDLIVVSIFRSLGIEKPSYLDIGAHHPYNISNTALLYLNGSRGINIEANPNLFEAFLRERPEDVNLNVGISDTPGTLDFYMIDKWSGRNTFDRHAAETFVASYPQFRITEIIPIQMVTVQEVLDRYTQGRFPDFLSLDVEGLDERILRSIDFSRSWPKVICVETVDASGAENAAGIIGVLQANHYFRLLKTGGNSIFVRREYEHLVR